MAEKGADLVLCQHTHCVGAREEYKGAELVYGQGNFLFDFLGVECWNTCVLCAVDFDETGAKVSYLPLEKKGAGTGLSKKTEILQGLYERSEEILKDGFVEENFEKLALAEYKNYIGYFGGLINERVLEGDKLPLLRNIMRCEVHSETVLTALRALQKEKGENL
jgi:poly-gamma-glutamate synthesis protein (capsule biosynthesis protein)